MAGENVNLPVSLAVLALSVALLFFGRGREGEAHPIIRKSPWIVGQLFGMTVMVMFAAGLMGIAANLNWLHSPPAASRRRGPSKNWTPALSSQTTTAKSWRMSILRMSRADDPQPNYCFAMRRGGSRRIL